MNHKKITTSIITCTLILTTVFSYQPVHAVNFESKESYYMKLCSSKKLTNSQQKTCKEFNRYLNRKNKELNEKSQDVKEDVKDTKESIEKISQKIVDIENQMTASQNELNYVQKNITTLQKDIDKQNTELSERLYAMQTTLNSRSYLSYLFDSESLSDLFRRIIGVSEILSYDQEMVEHLNSDLKEIETQKATLSHLQKNLNIQKANQKTLQQKFTAQLLKQNQSLASHSQAIAKNQESIESIQKNLAAIQKASDESKVENVTQATPNKKPSTDTNKPSSKPDSDKNETPSSPNVSSSEERGLKIANKALSRLGYMYLWGGGHTWSEIKNPKSTRFDCSGLVNWAHYQGGARLSTIHNTKSMISAGKGISRSQLQAGDVILFSSNNQASGVHHVGIYIGDNKMVHAPSTGKPIQVARLDINYWQKEWYRCRRLY